MMRVFVLQKIYIQNEKQKKKKGQLATYHSTGQVRVDTFFYKFISG